MNQLPRFLRLMDQNMKHVVLVSLHRIVYMRPNMTGTRLYFGDCFDLDVVESMEEIEEFIKEMYS